MQTLKTILDNELDRLISIKQFQEPTSTVSSGYKFLVRAIYRFSSQYLSLLRTSPRYCKNPFLLNFFLFITLNKKNLLKAQFEVIEFVIMPYSIVEYTFAIII